MTGISQDQSHLLDYRLYVLDRGGRIIRAHALEVVGDAEAKIAAQALEMSHRRELWRRARQVAIFEAQTEHKASAPVDETAQREDLK